MKKLFFALSLALVVGVGAGWGDAEVSAVSPSDVGLISGDLISATFSSDPDVYIVNEWGYKRLFLNPDIFQFYSHLGGFAQVKIVTPQVRDSFITSGYLRECETGDQRVWGVESVGEDRAMLHWINTTGEQAVLDDPYFFKKVFCINQREFSWYQIGSTYTSVRDVPDYVRLASITPPPMYPTYTPVYSTYTPLPPTPSPQFNLRIAAGGAGQLSCVGNSVTVHSSPYITWDDIGQGGLVDILRYNPVTGAYELIYQLGGQNYYPLDVNLPLTAPLKYRVRLAAQPWVMSNILDIPVYCSSPSPSATPVIRPIMSVENRTNSSRNPAFADGDSIRITVTDGAYRSNIQVYACHSHTGVSPSSGCTWGYTNVQGVWVFEYTLTTGAGNRSLWADAGGISSAQVHITIGAPVTTPTPTPVSTPVSTPFAICDYAAPPAGCSYVPGPNYNRETSCGMVLACESRVVTSAASPIGAHDEATCEMTHGWICDADNFSAPLDVHFYADGGPGVGVFLGAVSAGGGREYQVGDLCGGNSNHGYRFAIPTWLKDGKAHSIFAYAININSDGKQSGINPAIGGTPKVISCSSSASASSSRQTATLSRALGTGMAGDDVRTLQQELVRRGMLASDAITGYFGRLTASAVKNFQWKNNIISTGVVGPVTRDALQGQ